MIGIRALRLCTEPSTTTTSKRSCTTFVYGSVPTRSRNFVHRFPSGLLQAQRVCTREKENTIMLYIESSGYFYITFTFISYVTSLLPLIFLSGQAAIRPHPRVPYHGYICDSDRPRRIQTIGD